MTTEINEPGWSEPSQMKTTQNFTLPSSLSVLAVSPILDDRYAGKYLLKLGEEMAAQGHRIRLVTATSPNIQGLSAPIIPNWLIEHAPDYMLSSVELAACAKAIYSALCAEPTHIIQSFSIQTTYAAALATFAFTLRHPCTPEPAIVTTIVTTIDGMELGDSDAVCAQAKRHLRLLGDAIIVFTKRARDALVGGAHDQHLCQRVHVVTPGHDFNDFAGGSRRQPWHALDRPTQATVAVYRIAWERRQRDNRQALLPMEV